VAPQLQQPPQQQHSSGRCSSSNSNHREQLAAAATATSHAQLIEAAAAHSSLDVGKSFTIAAILGLQSQRKDYNNAINLYIILKRDLWLEVLFNNQPRKSC